MSPWPYIPGRLSPWPYISGRLSPWPYISGRLSPWPYISGEPETLHPGEDYVAASGVGWSDRTNKWTQTVNKVVVEPSGFLCETSTFHLCSVFGFKRLGGVGMTEPGYFIDTFISFESYIVHIYTSHSYMIMDTSVESAIHPDFPSI